MRERFGIDRLIEYGTAPVVETVKMVNPVYRDTESRVRSVSQKFGRKVSGFGQTTLELEGKNITEADLGPDTENRILNVLRHKP